MNMNDSLRDKLITILHIVNDWLKFAEAKNGILLAFCGTILAAILTYTSAVKNIPKYFLFGLIITTIILFFCSLICSISFLPKTNLERIVWRRSKPSKNRRYSKQYTDNFYYFGHLLKYQDSELLDALNHLYLKNQRQILYNKEDLDIANQIVINSEITSLKFKLFVVALWLLIISLIIIGIFLVIYLFNIYLCTEKYDYQVIILSFMFVKII